MATKAINKRGNTMFCRNCGNKLDNDAVFCTNCGKKITEKISKEEIKFCVNCGSKLDEDSAFCSNCGKKIEFNEDDSANTTTKSSEPEVAKVIPEDSYSTADNLSIVSTEELSPVQIHSNEATQRKAVIETEKKENTSEVISEETSSKTEVSEPKDSANDKELKSEIIENTSAEETDTKSNLETSTNDVTLLTLKKTNNQEINVLDTMKNSRNVKKDNTKSKKGKVLVSLLVLVCFSLVGFFYLKDLREKERIEELRLQENQEIPMVAVVGGTFKTGDGYHSDMPKKTENVSWFLIGKTEVTQKQWEILFENHSFFRGTDYPVDSVSWYEAIAYCNCLSEYYERTPCYSLNGDTNVSNWKDSDWDSIECNFYADGYRLPTEAEWEYAARGGNHNSSFRCSGSDKVDEVCWYFDNSKKTTHPVASKKPNALGIYDMSGNVDEWVWDYNKFNNYFLRRVRGGSYSSYLIWSSDFYVDCRNGEGVEPSVEYNGRGFRLVRSR